MTSDYARIHPRPKSGGEPIHRAGQPVGPPLVEFWRWSASDLLSNATRGVLAEFLAATALGVDTSGVREEWAAFDLETREGIAVEVKSAAYVQSWAQKRPSMIEFGVAPTRAWEASTATRSNERRRQADVYVFALLAHLDQATIDPLDVAQWRFYVAGRTAIDVAIGEQRKVGLPTLLRIAGPAVEYADLRAAVLAAAGR